MTIDDPDQPPWPHGLKPGDPVVVVETYQRWATNAKPGDLATLSRWATNAKPGDLATLSRWDRRDHILPWRIMSVGGPGWVSDVRPLTPEERTAHWLSRVG